MNNIFRYIELGDARLTVEVSRYFGRVWAMVLPGGSADVVLSEANLEFHEASIMEFYDANPVLPISVCSTADKAIDLLDKKLGLLYDVNKKEMPERFDLPGLDWPQWSKIIWEYEKAAEEAKGMGVLSRLMMKSLKGDYPSIEALFNVKMKSSLRVELEDLIASSR